MDETREYYPHLAVTSQVAKELAEFDVNDADDSLAITLWKMSLDDFTRDTRAYRSASDAYRKTRVAELKSKRQPKEPEKVTLIMMQADKDGILRPHSECFVALADTPESMDFESQPEPLPSVAGACSSPTKVTLGRTVGGKRSSTVMVAKGKDGKTSVSPGRKSEASSEPGISGSLKSEKNSQPEVKADPVDSKIEEWTLPQFPLVINGAWSLTHEDLAQLQFYSSSSGIPLKNFLEEFTAEAAKEIEEALGLVRTEKNLAGVPLLDLE